MYRGSHTLSAEATPPERARATAADHIGAADRREVVFVRNATEAINLVAYAWGAAIVGAGDRIVLTEMETIEHRSLLPPREPSAEDDWSRRRRGRRPEFDAYANLLERGLQLVAVVTP